MQAPQFIFTKESKSTVSAAIFRLGNIATEIEYQSNPDLPVQISVDATLSDLSVTRCTMTDITPNSYNIKDETFVLKPLVIRCKTNKKELRTQALELQLDPVNMAISYTDVKWTIDALTNFQPLIQAISSASPKECSEVSPEITSELAPAGTSLKPHQKISISVAKIKLTLLDDKQDPAFITPLCVVAFTGLSAVVSSHVQEIKVDLEVYKIFVNFYNAHLATFEPVLEPWSLQLSLAKEERKTTLMISASEIINVNFTLPFLETMYDILDLQQSLEEYWKRRQTHEILMSPKKKKFSRSQVTFNPYILKNMSGRTITIWQQNKEQTHQILPNSGDYVLEADSSSRHETETVKRNKLSFTIENIPTDPVAFDLPVENVYFDVVGNRKFAISSQDKSYEISVDVEYTGGIKVITIYGGFVICNDTDVLLSAKIEEIGLEMTLEPDTSFSLPIISVPLNVNSFKLYPLSWTSEEYFREPLPFSSQFEKARHISRSGDLFWACNVTKAKVNNNDFRDNVFEVHAPFVLENLLPQTMYISILNVESTIEKQVLSSGHTLKWYTSDSKDLESLSSRVSCYKEASAIGKVDLCSPLPSKSIQCLDQRGKEFELLMDYFLCETGTRYLSFYTRYVITNLTGLPITLEENSTKKLIMTPSSDTTLGDSPRSWYNFSLKSQDYAEDYYNTQQEQVFYGSESKLRMKVGSSESSTAFPLGLKNEGRVQVFDSKNNCQYDFSVSVSPAPGLFWRTGLTKIYSAYVLVNQTDVSIMYRQEATSQTNEWFLENGEQIPFHWQSRSKPKLLQISTLKCDQWSESFDIDSPTEFQIRMSDASREFHISVCVIGSTNYVIFSEVKIPLYKIENNSTFTCEVWQDGVQNANHQTVEPATSTIFFWDKPQEQKRKLHLACFTGTSSPTVLDVPLDEIAEHSTDSAYCRVVVEGPTRVLKIFNAREGEEITESKFEGDTLSVTLALTGIGLSCVDRDPKSLLYLTLQTLVVNYQVSDISESIEALITNVQLDNQIRDTPYPVVLCPASPSTDDSGPFFKFVVVKDITQKSINFIQYFALGLREFEVRVDGIFLFQVSEFMAEVCDYVTKRGGGNTQLDVHLNPMVYFPPRETQMGSDLFYFRELQINPIKASLSFTSVSERTGTEAKSTADLQFIMSYLGMLTDLEEAPVHLNGLFLEHPFDTKQGIVDKLVKHYTFSLLQHMYLIIGSADFLGNPVSLFRNVGTGVYDFFFEPLQGLVKSPHDFTMGIRKGTTSLLSKSIYGVFGSASKISGTLAKVGTAVLDEEYKKSRREAQNKKARHATEGLAMGLRDFSAGVYKGVTGMVLDPTRGIQEEGTIGFFKGLGSGMAGAIVKPMVGAIDLVTRTTEGISGTATTIVNEAKVRVRPARFFSPDRVLRVYNLNKAVGNDLLQAVDEGIFGKEDYKFHMPLTDNTYVLVTNAHVICISFQETLFSQNECVSKWVVKVEDIKDVSQVVAEITLQISGRENLVLKTKGKQAGDRLWRKMMKVLHRDVGGKRLSRAEKEEFIRLDAMILGGGWNALSCAAALKECGVTDFLILEKEEGSSFIWGPIYDWIAYKTPVMWLYKTPPHIKSRFSALPSTRANYLSYVKQYILYHSLDSYFRNHSEIQSITYIGEEKKDASDGEEAREEYKWEVVTNNKKYITKSLAIGQNALYSSLLPVITDQDKYTGEIIHGVEYSEKILKEIPGQNTRVLCVGTSNMAIEILSDLLKKPHIITTSLVETPTHVLTSSASRRMHKMFAPKEDMDHLVVTKHDSQFWRNIDHIDSFASLFTWCVPEFGAPPAEKPLIHTHVGLKSPTIDTQEGSVISQIISEHVEIYGHKIERFHGKKVLFSEGLEREFDYVIFADPGLRNSLKPTVDSSLFTMKTPQPSLKYPCSSNYPCLVPKTDGRGRSVQHPSLFFLGFDLGYYGPCSLGIFDWYCGEQMAKEIGFVDNSALETNLTTWNQMRWRRIAYSILKKTTYLGVMSIVGLFFWKWYRKETNPLLDIAREAYQCCIEFMPSFQLPHWKFPDLSFIPFLFRTHLRIE
eukprot:TRINITY_DN10018_c0_g1_i1.p1 TRINITY_DN10018_c0_g1~~TRINITY_DN10018_c0_g1_i1.p1  ORF type:complete len:2161 (-),score=353.61 TRINITY_DN10018_c0_g1_i1:18-6164(-)